MPTSHHGTERPEAKNSDMFWPALRAKKRAGIKQIATETKIIAQSM
jgi:hypothetical protein